MARNVLIIFSSSTAAPILRGASSNISAGIVFWTSSSRDVSSRVSSMMVISSSFGPMCRAEKLSAEGKCLNMDGIIIDVKSVK